MKPLSTNFAHGSNVMMGSASNVKPRSTWVNTKDDAWTDGIQSKPQNGDHTDLEQRSEVEDGKDKENSPIREDGSHVSTKSDRSQRSNKSRDSLMIQQSNQFWTTLVAHAASAAMIGSWDEKTKEQSANAAARALLSECQAMERMSRLRVSNGTPPLQVTHRNVRDAAARAAIAVMQSGGNQEAAATVAKAIIKEGWIMLGSTQKATAKDDDTQSILSSNVVSSSKSMMSSNTEALISGAEKYNNVLSSSKSMMSANTEALISNAEKYIGSIETEASSTAQSAGFRMNKNPLRPASICQEKVGSALSQTHEVQHPKPRTSTSHLEPLIEDECNNNQLPSQNQPYNIDAAVDAIHTAVARQLKEDEEELGRKQAKFLSAVKTLHQKLDELDNHKKSAASQEDLCNGSSSKGPGIQDVHKVAEQLQDLASSNNNATVANHSVVGSAIECTTSTPSPGTLISIEEDTSIDGSSTYIPSASASFGQSALTSSTGTVSIGNSTLTTRPSVDHTMNYGDKPLYSIMGAPSSGSKSREGHILALPTEEPSTCFSIPESDPNNDESPIEEDDTVILSVGECRVQTERSNNLQHTLPRDGDNIEASPVNNSTSEQNEAVENDAIEVILVTPPPPPQLPTSPNVKDQFKDFFQQRLKKVTFDLENMESHLIPAMNTTKTDLTEGTHEAQNCQYYHELMATPTLSHRKGRIPSRHGRNLRKMFKEKLRRGGLLLSKGSKKTSQSSPIARDDGDTADAASALAAVADAHAECKIAADAVINSAASAAVAAATLPGVAIESTTSAKVDEDEVQPNKPELANGRSDVGDKDCGGANSVVTEYLKHSNSKDSRDIKTSATKDSMHTADSSLDQCSVGPHPLPSLPTFDSAEMTDDGTWVETLITEYTNETPKSRFTKLIAEEGSSDGRLAYLMNINPSLPSFDSQESTDKDKWAESMLSKYTIGELRKMFLGDKGAGDDDSVGTAMTSLAGYNFV